jgi:RNA polymerase sigma-70 factor (ECF subfamily)
MAAGGPVEGILADHQGLVRAFFRRRCANPADAEDLAQEAFCAIVAAFPRFRQSSSPSTWVWAICRNVFCHHLSITCRHERVVREMGTALTVGARSETDDGGVEALRAVLGGLRPGERVLYECFYAKGLSVRETARLLLKPEGTIKYQLFMLRTKVRDLLGAGARKRGGRP